eukprot:6180204-Pleurochrysis_carterae.AAC.4
MQLRAVTSAQLFLVLQDFSVDIMLKAKLFSSAGRRKRRRRPSTGFFGSWTTRRRGSQHRTSRGRKQAAGKLTRAFSGAAS